MHSALMGLVDRGEKTSMLRLFSQPLELGKAVLLSGVAACWARLPADDLPALRIHRIFHHSLWRNAGLAAKVGLCLGFLPWIVLILGLDAYCSMVYGPDIKRKTGKGIVRQSVEQIVLAVRFAVPPLSYYAFEFFDDDRRKNAISYLYRFELKGKGVYSMLRARYSSKETTEALSNKAAFALRCEAHQVPVVPVVAVVENGVIRAVVADGDPLPPISLFVKPLRGSGGEGASAWVYKGDGTWCSDFGKQVTVTGLEEHLRALSRKNPYTVRPLVSNHHDLRNLTAGALSTVRVITCLDEDGCPEVTNALFKMAVRPDAVVDNYHAGGIVSKVDLTTGRLDKAIMGTGSCETHPATGAPIAGRVLPMWGEVLDVARGAHRAFSDHIAIGWDIAILDDGPKLIEGNKSPGLDAIQVTLGGPLGSARLGELLAIHLERAFEKRYTALSTAQ
jgi:hypothetical protein